MILAVWVCVVWFTVRPESSAKICRATKSCCLFGLWKTASVVMTSFLQYSTTSGIRSSGTGWSQGMLISWCQRPSSIWNFFRDFFSEEKS